MKISIVIPTYNEEKYLPKLLDSIKRQTFKDYEIIVADAHSTDKTRKIAERYGTKVVDGGIPAVGRNAGAKISKGKYIYFFDADIKIPKKFLENTIKEMEEKNLDIGTCELRPLSSLEIDKIIQGVINQSVKAASYTDMPHAIGACIIIKKEIHNKINGFDEKIKLWEDHDYVKRASKFGKFGFLDSSYVFVSVRRLKKEGRLNFIKKSLMGEIHWLTKGKITKDILNYEFGNFKKSNKISDFESNLIKLERQIKKLNRKIKETNLKALLKDRLKELEKIIEI